MNVQYTQNNNNVIAPDVTPIPNLSNYLAID